MRRHVSPEVRGCAVAISASLNARQRQAVEHGDGPLLVLAGPGAGKTRVIIHRVAHLIESGRAEPGQILALTFTNKAAQELVSRVHDLLGESIGSDVWVGTFHNTCARILRESSEALDIREDFAIFDQESQDAMLVECLRHASLPADVGDVARLRNVISARKSAMEDPLDGDVSLPDGEDERVLSQPGFLDALRGAIEEYERRLGEYGAYDFDDLLRLTVERLRSHPAVMAKYHAKFRHVLVDEYQDINYTQYELLRLVAPAPYRITAVGDEDQSIYSWRGSDPKWVRRLREEMQPTVIELDEHYRSTRTVLHAATELISRNERLRETALKTNNPVGEPLYAYALANEEAAAAHTTKLIGLLHREAHFAYRDIAVFYRNHHQADLVEQALDRADIPIQRVRRSSEMLDADETRLVAWLRHICFGLPKHLAAALTFPASVLDEWTRVWFQWKAQQSGRPLGDVLRNPGDDTPPLTRVALAAAMASLDRLRERIAAAPAGEAARVLLDELEHHRSPFHRDDADAVPHWEQFPRMAEAGDILLGALHRGETVHVVSDAQIDSIAAAAAIVTTLTAYFGADARHSVYRGGTLPDADADDVVVFVGDLPAPDRFPPRLVWLGAPEHVWPDCTCPRPPDGAPAVSAWVAQRLCQHLLALAEEPLEAEVVVYDLETTGKNVRRCEIVEFAATRLGEPEEHEHLYVRPRRGIPAFLTRVHGIDDKTVRDKPPIEEQIGPIRRFLGSGILVGHNIVDFDNRILERDAGAHLREILPNPSYDTLTVAQRLFPGENHKLTALARKFDIPYGTAHRANDDTEVSKMLFHRLRREESERRAAASLAECLPFVAIGAVSREAWSQEAFEPYRNAFARWTSKRDASRAAVDALPQEFRVDAVSLLAGASTRGAPETDDERRWQQVSGRLLRRAQRFEATSPATSVRDFLNSQSLAEPTDELDEAVDAVTLMTLHSAKGTEFRAVIMIGVEEDVLPSFRAKGASERARAMLAEERRLCYVGMTRARERLYFVSSTRRDGRDREPSRFLREIPSNLLQRWSPSRGGS